MQFWLVEKRSLRMSSDVKVTSLQGRKRLHFTSRRRLNDFKSTSDRRRSGRRPDLRRRCPDVLLTSVGYMWDSYPSCRHSKYLLQHLNPTYIGIRIKAPHSYPPSPYPTSCQSLRRHHTEIIASGSTKFIPPYSCF